MANIYEISNQFPFLKILEETGELDPEAVKGALEVAKEDLSAKVEDYCKVIANFEAEIAGLKTEEDRLSSRRKVKENAVKHMKEAIKYAMETAGEPKLACGTFTTSIQKNPKSVVMDEQYIENIPAEYLKYKEPEIDRKKIKADIEAGKDLSGLAHLEQTTLLRIR